MGFFRLGAFALGVVLACARADAQPVQGAVPSASPVTTYQGVVPVLRDVPAMVLPKGDPPKLTWSGFQRREQGNARVFLQFSGPARYETNQKGNRYQIEFPGATVFKKNNLRRMDTRHFKTVVRSFRIRQGRRGAPLLEIDTTTTEPPIVRTDVSNLFHYVYVDFPAPAVEEPSAEEAQTKRSK